MKVEPIGYSGEDDSIEIYVFKVNMDNTPLLNEIKQKRFDETVARNQFLYANVLIGLSLLLQEKQENKIRLINGQDGSTRFAVEDHIYHQGYLNV